MVGTATSEAGAERITARIAELGGKGRGIVLNVCDGEASAKAVVDTVAEFGRIDVLVNNAGITRDTLVMRMKDDAWNDVVETDLTAAFRLARACVPDEVSGAPYIISPIRRGRHGRSRVRSTMPPPRQASWA